MKVSPPQCPPPKKMKTPEPPLHSRPLCCCRTGHCVTFYHCILSVVVRAGEAKGDVWRGAVSEPQCWQRVRRSRARRPPLRRTTPHARYRLHQQVSRLLTSCAGGCHDMPPPPASWLLTLKVVSESRVTWATSVPILVFLGLSVLDLGPMYATDRRQTRIVT